MPTEQSVGISRKMPAERVDRDNRPESLAFGFLNRCGRYHVSDRQKARLSADRDKGRQ